MTRSPITAAPNIPIASAAHTMAAEGIDSAADRGQEPQAAGGHQPGRSARSDAVRGKQQESGETFDELISAGFEKEKDSRTREDFRYEGRITPQMSGTFGHDFGRRVWSR